MYKTLHQVPWYYDSIAIIRMRSSSYGIEMALATLSGSLAPHLSSVHFQLLMELDD